MLQAHVVWCATRGADPSRWIGSCEGLGIVTEADSLDALHILMLDLVEDGEFDEFLRRNGWSSSSEDSEGAPAFNIPWNMIAEGQDDPVRRVA
ncbi:MAG: hypothetical protein GDA52_07365 [Rhodobacteraceae bacterium]|nr:hypothetical protein [Paracoccaceae bacterium]